MNDRNKTKEWNDSYNNKDNFIFYPNEEIIRFISKYIRKRIGYQELIDVNEYKHTPRVLDFGCGIGRHVMLIDDFDLDAYGFDLSTEAINVARTIFNNVRKNHLIDRVIESDITNLSYKDAFFDFMLSHGVLDSMPFEIGRKGMKELHRCLVDGGFIYFDLISTSDSSYNNQLEVEVSQSHEFGTIQSYFNHERIDKLIEDLFVAVEVVHIERYMEEKDVRSARYHIVAKKIDNNDYDE